jgi:hypothetical protein
MGLENANVIDLVTSPQPGRLELVITDAGLITDPAERREKLIAKLRAHVHYLLSDQFARDYPDISLDRVGIAVVCSTPPTSEMLNITRLRPRVEPAREFAVRFALFDGHQEVPLTVLQQDVPDRQKILPRLVTPAFRQRVPAGVSFPHHALGRRGCWSCTSRTVTPPSATSWATWPMRWGWTTRPCTTWRWRTSHRQRTT